MHQYRQGDVFLIEVAALPANRELIERENGAIILAHGEATGHSHHILDLACGFYRDEKSPTECYLLATDDVTLLHEEHGAIGIPSGVYRVIRQREYHPEAIRNVQD